MKRNTLNSFENKELKNKSKPVKDNDNAIKVKEETGKRLTVTPNVSIPKEYVKKPSASDVYNAKTTGSNIKTTRSRIKTNAATTSKDSMKSTPSSVSINTKKSVNIVRKDSIKSKSMTKVDNLHKSKEKSVIKQAPATKSIKSTNKPNLTPRTSKGLLFSNVTVNSPPSERKLISNVEKSRKPIERKIENNNEKETEERQRKKTRTLAENEVIILNRDTIDNNKEMKMLSNKLIAKPKSFFIDLDEQPPKKVDKNKLDKPLNSEDDEYSYEDDFESYESDFESYHSENNISGSEESDKTDESHANEDIDYELQSIEKKGNIIQSDEERMLDSGSFELREAQRSANKVKPIGMDDIVEDFEYGKNKSLTDEGFLEMNSSNGNTSMNTYTHNEVLERPLQFIDLKMSTINKKKRLFNERLQQRAKDLLPMIKLHEMSYTLFEMKPIPYDVYMATFGKSNYVQSSAQTYDDGVDEEIQTEVIFNESKWTQYPVKFSKDEIYIDNVVCKKNSKSVENLMSKFTFLLYDKPDNENEIANCSIEYKNNPLRIYLEQRNGVGKSEMLLFNQYKTMINNTDFAVDRLAKFLKKAERKVSNVLSLNIGNKLNNFEKSTNLPFSKGYKLLKIENEILKERDIFNVLFSENRNNILVTIHNKGKGIIKDKCLICIWDINATYSGPAKILVAIENVTLGKFKGCTEGVFVGALDDGSIHLWDLSEEPTWSDAQPLERKELKDVGERSTNKTQIELDREWNLQNRDVVDDEVSSKFWRASAFTNSAFCLQNNVYMGDVVALEFSQQTDNLRFDGRNIIGQVCSLQKKGFLIIWNIINEKKKPLSDIGKAYWSKITLEKSQSINLLNYMDTIIPNNEGFDNFNLNLAKRRISGKRKDMELIKSLTNKVSNKVNDGRPSSVAGDKRKNAKSLPDECVSSENWESGALCYDMKIITINNMDNYLIGKNCGEVLHCTRGIGSFKINRLRISDSSTSISTLQTSTAGVFLAGTDTGHIHICSTTESRVLLTLDSSTLFNDERGSLGSFVSDSESGIVSSGKQRIKSIQWSLTNPFHIFTLSQEGVVSEWDLLHSDIKARYSQDIGVRSMVLADDQQHPSMVMLTSEGEVQVHLVTNTKSSQDQNILFTKYIALQ